MLNAVNIEHYVIYVNNDLLKVKLKATGKPFGPIKFN